MLLSSWNFISLSFFPFFSHCFGHVSPYAYILLFTIYLLVPPALNPIVYAVKTKEICKRVADIFILKPETQQWSNKWYGRRKIYSCLDQVKTFVLHVVMLVIFLDYYDLL
jgi:hypothetical protein